MSPSFGIRLPAALSIAAFFLPAPLTRAIPTSYANVFLDPRWVVAHDWSNQTTAAQGAVVSGAHDLALQGPWSVVNKTILPPSNNTHDYLSFAPYWWPDCSNVDNTTALTQNQIWTECKYVERDGQFNPDQHLVNNTGDISALGDSVLYASLAWAITGNGSFAADIADWINVWFVNNATAQTPNLNYAQLIRGVGEMVGAHTGLLDFKGFAKIATGVLSLKLGGAPEWTTEVDTGFTAWINAYMPWVTTNTLAVQERDSLNNHGSFYYNQLTALYLLLGDKASAKTTLDDYFNGIFQGQINATGEQPYEAVRTHPIHYRAYNLGAIMTNARMGDYLGLDYWNTTTKLGGTIQKAVDFAMVQNPAPTNEQGAVQEMYQIVACAATVYGDPTGKYKAFLSSVLPSEAFFLWDFWATINATTTTITSTSTPTGASGSKKTHGAASISAQSNVLTGFSLAALGALFAVLTS